MKRVKVFVLCGLVIILLVGVVLVPRISSGMQITDVWTRLHLFLAGQTYHAMTVESRIPGFRVTLTNTDTLRTYLETWQFWTPHSTLYPTKEGTGLAEVKTLSIVFVSADDPPTFILNRWTMGKTKDLIMASRVSQKDGVFVLEVYVADTILKSPTADALISGRLLADLYTLSHFREVQNPGFIDAVNQREYEGRSGKTMLVRIQR